MRDSRVVPHLPPMQETHESENETKEKHRVLLGKKILMIVSLPSWKTHRKTRKILREIVKVPKGIRKVIQLSHHENAGDHWKYVSRQHTQAKDN